MNILVTGGAGFIGVNLVRLLLEDTSHTVLNVDKLRVPGSAHTIALMGDHARHRFIRLDIRDGAELTRLITEFKPDSIIHLAAESHVDRSIAAPGECLDDNVIGTFTVLEVALRYWRQLPAKKADEFRFLQVSTDEVMGALSCDDAPFTETSPYRPRSPYAATKAAADHLVQAWFHTYGLPAIITNCSNNYGPWQFPEKLIPLTIVRALAEESIPVYGDGANIRDWLYVIDHVEALLMVLQKGRIGQRYNIGGQCEHSNLAVVKKICAMLDVLKPRRSGRYLELLDFVADRPGHDFRYAMDTKKIQAELGWRARTDFETGLSQTVQWYLDNPVWVSQIMNKSDNGERSGLKVASKA